MCYQVVAAIRGLAQSGVLLETIVLPRAHKEGFLLFPLPVIAWEVGRPIGRYFAALYSGRENRYYCAKDPISHSGVISRISGASGDKRIWYRNPGHFTIHGTAISEPRLYLLVYTCYIVLVSLFRTQCVPTINVEKAVNINSTDIPSRTNKNNTSMPVRYDRAVHVCHTPGKTNPPTVMPPLSRAGSW